MIYFYLNEIMNIEIKFDSEMLKNEYISLITNQHLFQSGDKLSDLYDKVLENSIKPYCEWLNERNIKYTYEFRELANKVEYQKYVIFNIEDDDAATLFKLTWK